ncbi:MAG: LysR family transcriptional regulator [Clostridia bacterium]|nr:LysR family transcriptional regulator [Clostridia bacterium]
MELLQLTYFCSAAETENFSVTARKYGVPASNISQSIHRLEDELGQKLFDRSANRIKLNANGIILYENTKKALNLLTDAKDRICKNDELSGEIKLLIETNRRLVSNAIEKFRIQHENVSFFINHTPEIGLSDYDFIVTDRLISNKYLEKTLLLSEDIHLAVKKTNPIAQKNNLCLSDLEHERFVTMGKINGLHSLVRDLCADAGFVPDIAVQSDDPYYVRRYVEMGLGVTLFPALSWKGLFSDDVICVKITDVARNTYVYRDSRKYLSKVAETFIEMLIGDSRQA